ncbi:MAG: aminotransferase class V-fold PLP-dependent enzyme [Balneolaceae bacterium]
MNSPLENSLHTLRSKFPHIEEGYTYMNHCAISPLSNPVRQALERYLEERNRGPVENFEQWMEVAAEGKEKITRLINASSPGQIAFTGNTSDGLSIVAEGVSWNRGDQILLNDMEFPANVHPFRALHRKGVTTTVIKTRGERITAEEIWNAITPNTRMVTVSAVQYLGGYRADLRKIGELCRQENLLFVVDGIQALGADSIDVQDTQIDALATGGHKWLMAPMGIGFLYLSDRLMNLLEPVHIGWRSVEQPWELTRFDQPWRETADRFETGTPNMSGITGLNASLNLLLEVGISDIEQHLKLLTRHASNHIKELAGCTVVTPMGESERAGILSFRLPEGEDPEELVRKLKQEKFILSSREGRIRIAPHFYNTIYEVDELFARIRTYR